jgi:hypothetical protein
MPGLLSSLRVTWLRLLTWRPLDSDVGQGIARAILSYMLFSGYL